MNYQDRIRMSKRKCEIDGCDKAHWVLGLCNMHYNRQRRHGDPLIVYKKGVERINVGECIVQGCNKNQYTRHMCINHYWAWRKYGDPVLQKRRGAQRGPQNPNWKGGVAYYKNHSLMKKLRIQKLEQVNYKCEDCGEHANFIFHKNGDIQDQRIENYLALCQKCFRHKPMMSSKYIRLYGKRLADIAEYYGVSCGTIQRYLTGIVNNPPFLERAKREGKEILVPRF